MWNLPSDMPLDLIMCLVSVCLWVGPCRHGVRDSPAEHLQFWWNRWRTVSASENDWSTRDWSLWTTHHAATMPTGALLLMTGTAEVNVLCQTLGISTKDSWYYHCCNVWSVYAVSVCWACPSTPVHNIWAMMIVWSMREKIIITVLCCIVYCSYAQS